MLFYRFIFYCIYHAIARCFFKFFDKFFRGRAARCIAAPRLGKNVSYGGGNPSGSARAEPPPFTQGRQELSLYTILSLPLCSSIQKSPLGKRQGNVKNTTVIPRSEATWESVLFESEVHFCAMHMGRGLRSQFANWLRNDRLFLRGSFFSPLL